MENAEEAYREEFMLAVDEAMEEAVKNLKLLHYNETVAKRAVYHWLRNYVEHY